MKDNNLRYAFSGSTLAYSSSESIINFVFICMLILGQLYAGFLVEFGCLLFQLLIEHKRIWIQIVSIFQDFHHVICVSVTFFVPLGCDLQQRAIEFACFHFSVMMFSLDKRVLFTSIYYIPFSLLLMYSITAIF